ncbi:MAG TPA: glycosyltransferase family 39 protein [Anaerolineae bacterium]
MLVALLSAMALASVHMATKFLWWDENWSTQIAGTGMYGPLSPAQIWQNAISDPYHPPLFYLLLAGWSRIFGSSQFALRLLPLFTGLLTLACGYRFAAWLGGRRLGVATLAIMSASAYLLYYFAELRPYMLHALFGLITSALYWRLINGKRSGFLYIGFMLSTAGLLYTHYFAFIVLAALGSYHILFVRKDVRWWLIVACILGGVVLFLPWLSIVLRAVTSVSADPRFSVLKVNELFALLADGLSNGVLPFLALLVIGSPVAWRTAGGRFVLWSGTIILILALLLNHFVPMLTHLRYIISVWGFALIVAAYGAVWLWHRLPSWRVIVGLLLISWWVVGSMNMLKPDFQNRMFREPFVRIFRPNLPLYAALQTVESDVQSHDVMLFDSPVQPWAVAGGFAYYTQNWSIPHSMLSWVRGDEGDTLTKNLHDYLTGAQRVWFGYETLPPDFRRAAFERVATNELAYCETRYQSPEIRIDLYARNGQCCRPSTAEIARYREGIVLHSITVTRTSADAISLLANWSVDAAVSAERYSVGFYVLDADHKVIAQTDAGLQTHRTSCQQFDLPRMNLPSGDHTLFMTIYAWKDLTRLTGASGNVTGELLPVTTLHID